MTYTTGTVDVEQGSPIVVGNLTSWLGNVAAGAVFTTPASTNRYLVLSVDSDTQLTLSGNFLEADALGSDYEANMDLEGFLVVPYDGASIHRTPKVRVARFGDGYEQRAAYGINNNRQRWNLTFDKKKGNLDPTAAATEIESIDAFLVSRGGAEAFNWIPPGQTSALKFVCRQHSRRLDNYVVVQSITATFEEVFE